MTSVEMRMPRVCILGALAGTLLLAGVAFVGLSETYFDNGVVRRDQERRLYEYETSSSGSPTDSSSSGSNSKPKWYTPMMFGGFGTDIIGYIIYGIASIAFAWLYKLNVVDKVPDLHQQSPTGRDDFKDGLFDCISRGQLPCIVCCCPFVRQAHTNQIAGTFPFWMTFWLYTIGFGCCCQLCLTVWFRMHLKAHLGVRDNPVNDFCLAWLCWYCVIGQMALNVDDLLEYEVEFPFTVNFYGREDGNYQTKPVLASQGTAWD